MVVVQVEWLAGRTPEQKEELVAGITDILGRVGSAQRENVHVVLHDVPPSNWGRAGELVEPPQRGPQENLQLEELAPAGQHRFFFICVPLKFVGATGSPVRPLAIVSGDS